ncbi:hypothetical protein L3V82_08025 [Thiotrichales bacterium 19S3-7]|nr:hypothetical protein [Thiotrichales bacterium 19S3-7]MCF6802107.1 hypothetical protein [Thiotrichales bacterium 19S3-11]
MIISIIRYTTITIAFIILQLALVGCGDSSDSSNNTPSSNSQLVVTSDGIIVQGYSGEILVTLDQSVSGLKLGATASVATNIKVNFIDPIYQNIFKISYNANCNSLSTSKTCTIVFATKNDSSNFIGDKFKFTISGLIDGTEYTTSVNNITLKSLTHNLDPKSLGSGSSTNLTLSNNTGIDIDMTGIKFTIPSNLLSVDNTTCTGQLINGSSCTLIVNADNQAQSENIDIGINSSNNIKILTIPVALVRPSITILPELINIGPYSEQTITIQNSSAVDALNLNVNLPILTDVTLDDNNCGNSLSPLSSCQITLSSSSDPSGVGLVEISGDNFNSANREIIAMTPLFLMLFTPYDSLTTNTKANKQIVLNVGNNLIAPYAVEDLLFKILPTTFEKLSIVEFLSTCYSGMSLSPGETCQYVLDYALLSNPEEPETDIVDILIDATNSSELHQPFELKSYQLVYNIPANLKSYHLGLASTLVNAVYYSENILYVATMAGLSISEDNGLTWANITAANGIINNIVNDVFVVGDSIYLATASGLSISSDNAATWNSFTADDGIASNDITSVFVANGIIYLTTNNGLSISYDQGLTWSNISTAAGLGNNLLLDVFVHNNNIYVATANGLSVSYDGGTSFTNKTVANGLASNFVYSVFADDDYVYVATNDGLSISDDEGLNFTETKTTTNGLSSNIIYDVFVTDTHMYVATINSLAVSTDSGNTFTNMTTADGLGTNNISKLFASGNKVFAATLAGMSASEDNGNNWVNFTAINNIGYGAFTTSLVIHNNQLYVGTDEGLATSIDGGLTWSTNTSIAGISSLFSFNEKLFIATFGEGIFISDDNGVTFTNITMSNGLPSDLVNVIKAAEGFIFVGTEFGLSISYDDGSSWESFTTVDGLVGNIINDIEFAEAFQLLFIGTTTGLSIYDGDSFANYTTNEGLPNNWINRIFLDSINEILYIGTPGGLTVYDGGESLNTITQADGLAYNDVSDIFATGIDIFVTHGTPNNIYSISVSNDSGDTWEIFGTENGISSSNINGIVARGANIFLTGTGGLSTITTPGLEWSILNTENSEISSDDIFSVFVDNDNVIYIATNNGLGISTDNGLTWQTINTSNNVQIPSDSLFDIFVYNGVIYIATEEDGIGVSEDGGISWVNITSENGLIDDQVTSLFVNHNYIYVATANGLSISADNGLTWMNRNTEDGLGDNYISEVFVENGIIYAATDGGLSISNDDGDSFSNLTTSNGLDTNSIYGVFVSNGIIYLATDNGISISEDDGNTWNNIAGGTTIQVFAAGNNIYAATDGSGVKISHNGPSSTILDFAPKTIENGVGSDVISCLFVRGSSIYAGTNENGLSISKDYLQP